jgi:hypothetical protein
LKSDIPVAQNGCDRVPSQQFLPGLLRASGQNTGIVTDLHARMEFTGRTTVQTYGDFLLDQYNVELSILLPELSIFDGLDKDYIVFLLKHYRLWCCVFGLCQNAEKQHLQDIAATLPAYQFQSNTVCL